MSRADRNAPVDAFSEAMDAGRLESTDHDPRFGFGTDSPTSVVDPKRRIVEVN